MKKKYYMPMIINPWSSLAVDLYGHEVHPRYPEKDSGGFMVVYTTREAAVEAYPSAQIVELEA